MLEDILTDEVDFEPTIAERPRRERKKAMKYADDDYSNDESSDESNDDFGFNPQIHCSTCKREDPPFRSKKNIEWIACDSCNNWYHDVCDDATSEDLDAPEYTCKLCRL